jgi:hypothetical protein
VRVTVVLSPIVDAVDLAELPAVVAAGAFGLVAIAAIAAIVAGGVAADVPVVVVVDGAGDAIATFALLMYAPVDISAVHVASGVGPIRADESFIDAVEVATVAVGVLGAVGTNEAMERSKVVVGGVDLDMGAIVTAEVFLAVAEVLEGGDSVVGTARSVGADVGILAVVEAFEDNSDVVEVEPRSIMAVEFFFAEAAVSGVLLSAMLSSRMRMSIVAISVLNVGSSTDSGIRPPFL